MYQFLQLHTVYLADNDQLCRVSFCTDMAYCSSSARSSWTQIPSPAAILHTTPSSGSLIPARISMIVLSGTPDILESSTMLISSSFITFNNLSPVVNIFLPPLFFLPTRRFLFRKLHDKLKLYPAFFCPVFGVTVFFRPTRNDIGIIRLARLAF